MALAIEDYALIGNTRTAALVGRDGAIDWLCLPRFDSGACFAGLLGDDGNGSWRLAPAEPVWAVRRRYRGDTLILETEFDTEQGTVAITDFMPHQKVEDRVDLVRMVRGVRGRVPMAMSVAFRFDYGHVVPWVSRSGDGLRAIAGPDGLMLHTAVPTKGRNFHTEAEFAVAEGEAVPFGLSWFPSHRPEPEAGDAAALLAETEAWWGDWAARCSYDGRWRDAVMRSLITLKALTYGPTGGIVAAPTTSLPEAIGGVRNWDYRFCWLRDATFTLLALLGAGFTGEAMAWRDWLLRAVAGEPKSLQILYGIAGERRLEEFELPWLSGYEGSRPVRVGNGAHKQLQLDVYGEIMDALHAASVHGVEPHPEGLNIEKALLDFLEGGWRQPDEGIWEVRGPRRDFTHSKLMAWVAFDRAVKAAERFGLQGPVERWRALRDEVHADVCARGFNPERGAFTQSYGSPRLDAALLLMPLVGFLPASDARVVGTVEAIRRELTAGGLVRRYATDPEVDGLPAGEAAFLPCSFWLADALALMGRRDEATAQFEHLLTLCNDVGLLSEEYDPERRRLVGNFPQAFSHVALVNTALNLDRPAGPAQARSES